MSKEIYISSTPHETRLAIVENDALAEIYYERENEYTLAGSIYNGRVTRVLPGMQSSFVDIGLERDAFLYITDFMEEAGDSADFEANANAGDHQRAPRREGGSGGQRDGQRGRGDSRSDGRGRGDREGQREPQTAAEPSDAELFTQAVAGMEPNRQGGGEGERSGGRRRRGRSRGEARQGGEQGAQVRQETSRPDESAPVESEMGGVTGIPGSVDEIGEGAPGADGSRRWRGRRGRRGNASGERQNGAGLGGDLGAGLGGAAPQENEEISSSEDSAEQADQPRAATGPVENAYGTEPWGEADFQQETAGQEFTERSLDLNASSDDEAHKSLGSRSSERSEGRSNERRSERGRSGRERSERGDMEQGPRYGETEYAAAPSEPIILPGESLGKYRKGAANEITGETSSVTAPAAVASTFVLPAGWDGGAVLPGETIRPRSGSAGSAAQDSGERGFARREDRGGNDRGQSERGRNDRGRGDRGRNDRGRDDRGRGEQLKAGSRSDSQRMGETRADTPAGDRRQPEVFEGNHEHNAAMRGMEAPPEGQTLSGEHEHQERGFNSSELREDAGQPADFQQREREAPAEALNARAEASDAVATYLTNPDQVPASHLITPIDSTFVAPPPVPEEAPVSAASHEYEPTEASASYRVDPAPPSEFRRPAAPVLEPEPAQAAMEETRQHEAAEILPQNEFEEWGQSGEVQPHDGHTLTSIFATGEMHSEDSESLGAEIDGPPTQEPAEPAAPILHETAVVERQNEAQSLPHFQPGSGLLEEEVMEEDEDGETLPSLTAAYHSSAKVEHGDDGEHETLEGAADLASMLRELSIDQITRPDSAHDAEEHDGEDEDEAEFDEDFEEEDQDYDPSELDDEEDAAEEGEAHGFDEAVDGEESEGDHAAGFGQPERATTGAEQGSNQQSPIREGRREGRRDGRRGDRNRRSGSGERNQGAPGERDRAASSGGERNGGERSSERDRSHDRVQDRSQDRGRNGERQHGRGRTMQSTNLPAISDLLKPGQELLCQIAKEPIAKKGARITSHIALPGRFLVFMPTVSHTGVSRKIESDGERRRLKEILLSEKGEAAGGFIVRTAAAGASEEELRSDLRFLLNLWNDIKARSESSKSPALIYHDLNLVERVLRDQVTDTFSAIWVDSETEYERVLRFLQRFQPSLIRRVKLYTKETPLFEQFGITEEINTALRSKVWLKSGGSIVINQTEALVAIDINTGKFVGKTARLEDTIVKTNLDAIPEIVRQIRLRDLGGIIIIDFIDMDERKNRNKVMAALEEELKLDRAPSKVLQFNDFGLVAITRKRVKQSLERTLSTTCGVCAGTGMVKSPVTVCNDIYVEMKKMQKHLDRGDVMLRVNPEVVKQLKSGSGRWLQEMEEMVGKTILVKSDPALHPEQFDIH